MVLTPWVALSIIFIDLFLARLALYLQAMVLWEMDTSPLFPLAFQLTLSFLQGFPRLLRYACIS